MRIWTISRSIALAAGFAAIAATGGAVAHADDIPYKLKPGAQALERVEWNADPQLQHAGDGGGHPDLELRFGLETGTRNGNDDTPVQGTRKVEIDFPEGLIGDLTNVATCSMDYVMANEHNLYAGKCPRDSAVGWMAIDATYEFGNPIPHYRRRIWRVGAGPHEVAAFGASILGLPIRMAVTVTPSGGHRVSVVSDNLPQQAYLRRLLVHLWGVPSLHQEAGGVPPVGYDGLGGPADCDGVFGDSGYQCAGGGQVNNQYGSPLEGAPRKPFLTNGSVCDTPLETRFAIHPYGNVLMSDEATAAFAPLTNCDQQPFDPSLDVAPVSSVAGQPSGYTVGINVPQNEDPDGVAAAHVKDVEVVLPEGTAISPPSADGLAACTDEQLDLNGDSDPGCPDASRIGSLRIDTPVLEEPVGGVAYLGSQLSSDPMSGEMYRLFLVAKTPGVLVKLKGAVKVNPATGQITSTFVDNPQMPFERIELRLDDGPRASLTTPDCGSHTAGSTLGSWAGQVRDVASSFAVDAGCESGRFAPGLQAGSSSPVAGGDSPFSLTVVRPDGDRELKTLRSVQLPEGLLGRVGSVPLCGDAEADAGTCSEGSRLGHVQVAAGAGSNPLWIPQAGKPATGAYLTGPYRGAPYGLSVVVPAQAGPFDLGRVVVRSALHVDRRTTQLTTAIDQTRLHNPDGSLDQVIEGAMPTMLKGVPLSMRELRVIVDRKDFMVNPTDCQEKRIAVDGQAVDDAIAHLSNRFQVSDCSSLAFRPRLGMRLTGKYQTRTGTHPGLTASLRQAKGQANIAKARVTLPKSVVLDPNNSTDPALVCDYDKGLASDCPASSLIGKATARTPLLNKPLTGYVYLVQGIRFGPTGNRIRTTPSLLVKLRGDVDIDLRGQTTVSRNRLVTTFDEIPDAPVSRFDIHINGGDKGILVVTRTRNAKINLCTAGQQTANTRINGQNGKRVAFVNKVKTVCAKKKAANRGSKRS